MLPGSEENTNYERALRQGMPLGADLQHAGMQAFANIDDYLVETGHTVLTIIGFLEIPIGPATVGMIADLINAFWYWGEGDEENAKWSLFFAFAPFFGDWFKLYRAGKPLTKAKIPQVIKTFQKTEELCNVSIKMGQNVPQAKRLLRGLEVAKRHFHTDPDKAIRIFNNLLKGKAAARVSIQGSSRAARASRAASIVLRSITNKNLRQFIQILRPRGSVGVSFLWQLSLWTLMQSKDFKDLVTPSEEKIKDKTEELAEIVLGLQLHAVGSTCPAGSDPFLPVDLEGEKGPNLIKLAKMYPCGICVKISDPKKPIEFVGFLTTGSGANLNQKCLSDLKKDLERALRFDYNDVKDLMDQAEDDKQTLPENNKKNFKESINGQGSGFEDGTNYTGTNNKQPYEDEEVLENEKPWYKKKYKEDSKNLKILIGHGSKRPKHVNNGGPFTQDPPKRRPVNKLSAPPMALDEGAVPQAFKESFLKITNADLTFKATKNINVEVPFIGDVLVFKQGKTYQGTIIGDNVSIKATEQGDQSLTKEKFLEKLEQAQGDLCQNVDCHISRIAINNEIKSFYEFMQQDVETQPTKDEPNNEKTFSDVEKQQMAQNTRLAGSMVNNFMVTGDIKQAIKQEIGYHPIAQKFANQFYEVMNEVLSKISNPEEKEIAALVTVLFGNILMIPIDSTASIYGSIPPDFIKEAGEFLSGIYAPIAEKITELQTIWQAVKEKYGVVDKAKKAAEDIKKSIENVIGAGERRYNIIDLPNAKGEKKQIVVIGDQQKEVLVKAFEGLLNSKGYQISRTFDFPPNSDFSEVVSNSASFNRYVEANKDKIGTFFISFGHNDKNEAMVAVEAGKLSLFLNQKVSDCEIIWVGNPPLQKGALDYEKKNKTIKDNNKTIFSVSRTPALRFIFVDPFNYLSDDETPGFYKDKITLSDLGAKKIFDGLMSGGKSPITADVSELTNLNEFVVSSQDLSGLKDNFKLELIKLSKRAKEVFGLKTKVNVISGIQGREGTTNHGTGLAADIRIYDGSKNLTAQQTYAFIISSILDGVIKDGAVGYYANNKGIYDPSSMDVTNENPHYDIRHGTKWFWFKCENDVAACRSRVNSPHFKKQNDDRDATPLDYQTSGGFTAQQISSTNILSLPKDVFELIGTYRRAITDDAKINVLDLFKDSFVTSLNDEQKNNASLIQDIFEDAGFSKNLIAAAIISSYEESGLFSTAVGNTGRAIGLFQINTGSGKLDPIIENKTRVKFNQLCASAGLNSSSPTAFLTLKTRFKSHWDPFVSDRINDGDYRFNPEKNAKYIANWTDRISKVKNSDENGKKQIPDLVYDFTKFVEIPGGNAPQIRKNKAVQYLKVMRV